MTSSNDATARSRPLQGWQVGATLAAILAVGALVVAAGSSAESYDPNKVVPNAAGKSADDAGSSEDCTNEVFLAQDQDLWHFVVPREKVTTGSGTAEESYTLTANITAVIIRWMDDGTVRYTGTDDYDQGNAGPNLFWVYTEPGRTIEQAWLEYTVTRDDGQPATETHLTTPHNLSHACAAGGGGGEPPTVDVDSEAGYDMVYDLVYDWSIEKSVDPAGLLAIGSSPFELEYAVRATRLEPPVPNSWRIVDGSMVVFGIVAVTDASMSDIEVTVANGTCELTEDANPSDDTYLYNCVIGPEPTVTSASGLDGANVTVLATVTNAYGTDEDSEVVPWGLPDSLVLADTVHATAYIVDGDRMTEASAGPLALDYTIEWMPETCPDDRVNTAEMFDGVTDESLGISDTLTVSGCPPVPGRTIGYWGNRSGAPQVVAAIPGLTIRYPALAPVPITNEASVRRFFENANCRGDCMSMFLAQALGAAMNAASGSFGDQPVFYGGECRTVDEWLDIALRTAIPTERTTRIGYKTLFDDLNNTRATRCASVS